ncbi:Fc receptor-like protein 1 [Anableps anableps]
MFASMFLVILGLCCCTKESNQFQLDHPRLDGPSEALVGEVVSFQCEIPNLENNETILLRLFKKDDRKVVLGEYSLPVQQEIGVFPKVIKAEHEGYLECVASIQNNTEINATVSNAHFLKVVEPVVGAEIVNTGPTELFEGTKLELQCKVASGNHLSYKWFLNGNLITQSPFHWTGENLLIISRVSSKDSGSYVCQAKNIFNETTFFTSNSSVLVITVKALVSTPEISLTVVKEDNDNYSAKITCQSARGDFPITFSLNVDGEVIIKKNISERYATFKVPVVLDQHSGWLQCQANNGHQTENSRRLPLKVVSVAGPVTVQSEYVMGKNYAVIGLRLYCKAAKGTHPHFQWYFNQKPLHDQGSRIYVVDQPPEQSMLHLSVGSRSSGKYHCKVWDSFDNSTVISSKRLYVDKEVVNRLPTSVVAVVFSCFTLLILLVLFCCLSGVMFRWKQSQQKSESTLEMDQRLDVSENKMDLAEYSEDPDVGRTSREDEFYQESEASEDDWPQIEQEKGTLEI